VSRDFINQLNRESLAAGDEDSELAARISAYELAFRMQQHAPEVVDISKESEATRRLYGLRESEHTMATGHEDLDQLSANESGGSRHKRGRPRVACHVVSVGGERAGDHRQHPHSTRTTPVRAQR